MADEPDNAAPAPLAHEQHVLGAGDIHDRLVALEMWMKHALTQIGILHVAVQAPDATGTEVAESPAED